MILLIDDFREFKDGREAIIARSSAAGISELAHHKKLSELWLDFDLGGTDDIIPVLRYLLEAYREQQAPTIGQVYIHTSSESAVQMMSLFLKAAGIANPIRAYADEHFII